MKPNHVHLHVRDLDRSKTFYKQWFALKDGLDEGEIQFLNSQEGFDLALSLDSNPAPLPDWFHWGFKSDSADSVQAIHDQMVEAKVPIRKPIYRDDSIALFRCADPDGHVIEIYWE